MVVEAHFLSLENSANPTAVGFLLSKGSGVELLVRSDKYEHSFSLIGQHGGCTEL